jgi:DNA polymerase-3 subunit epsilon
MKTIIFDTEATDLIPGQICQIASLIIIDGQVQGKNFFFSVDQMSQGAFEVHGLSMETLAELSKGEYFEDRAQELLLDYNSADLVVGHNVAADERYLRVELERCGLKLKKLNTFCTMNYTTGIMNMLRRVVTGRPKPPKLEELYTYYGITDEDVCRQSSLWFQGGCDKHDARFDTVATYMSMLAAISKGDLRGMQGLTV